LAKLFLERGGGRRSQSSDPVSRVIAIANQKGGVGKTSTALTLAASLAAAEQRTLLIDGDPQGNATSGMGVQAEEIGVTAYEVLLGEKSIKDAIVAERHFKHLDLVAPTPHLAGAEAHIVGRRDRERMT